jgi:hypothetical protein
MSHSPHENHQPVIVNFVHHGYIQVCGGEISVFQSKKYKKGEQPVRPLTLITQHLIFACGIPEGYQPFPPNPSLD